MSQFLITPDLFNNLNFDMDSLNLSSYKPSATVAADKGAKESTVLVVFSDSDINAALYYLVKSLEAPWESKAIATVLVQESIKKEFIEKLQQQLKPFDQADISNNVEFISALAVARKLTGQVIEVLGSNKMGPVLVADFTHEHFGDSPHTGIVTLHTFRTAKEAISLVTKESIHFSYASIWHANHAFAYELVAALDINVFFINCYHCPMAILEEGAKNSRSFVAMDNSYHYETLVLKGIQKCIAFPIGSIFAN